MMEAITIQSLAEICDHTFLMPAEAFRGESDPMEARRSAFQTFLDDAQALSVAPYAICVPIGDIRHVLESWTGTAPRIVSIAGFPDGSWVSTEQKVSEAKLAMALGAQEVDMVLDWRALKSGDYATVGSDVIQVTEAVHAVGGIIKVIIEAEALSDDEIRVACALLDQSGADFAKSSTGFGPGGATPRALRLMAKSFSRGIKMSGGVTEANVQELLEATGIEPPFDPMKLRIGESRLLQG